MEAAPYLQPIWPNFMVLGLNYGLIHGRSNCFKLLVPILSCSKFPEFFKTIPTSAIRMSRSHQNNKNKLWNKLYLKFMVKFMANFEQP